MWSSQNQSKVFTRVKEEGIAALQNKYPDIYFTTSDRSQTDPKFPAVLVREVGSIEQGQDLEGTSINAVLATFQVDVTDNKTQDRVNEVMAQVVKTMKEMRFSVISMPEFQNTNTTYRQTARFRRMIGKGDIL